MTDARKAADLAAARARHGVPADGLSDEQWADRIVDAAIAETVRPTTVLSRTEAIKAWCKDKPNVIIDAKEGSFDSGHYLTVAVNNRYIGVYWYPKFDADPTAYGSGTAAAIIARIDAALAKPAPQAEPSTREDLMRWLSEAQHQLAAVTAERDALAERLARRNRLETIARDALETFGQGRQTLKAVEECAEFIVAAHHYGDAKITREEYADEIAGVAITNAQMMLLLGDEHGPPAFERQLAKLEAAIATARTPER